MSDNQITDKTENLRWLTNMFNPLDPYADVIRIGFRESRDQAIQRYRRYLSDKIIGKPKATDKYTQEELEKMGMVGVYTKEESENISR